MKKGLLTIALLLLAIGLVCTPRAEALDCGGTAFIIPSTDTLPVPGSVNDEYTIAYRIQNTSIATSGTPIGATIKAGKRIYEWDQCNGTTCQDTFFPDVVQYVGCQPAAALVGKISCTANTTAIGPPVPGEVNPEVIIDVLQDIAFTPNEIKDLVIVTKKAIGCVDTAEPLIAFRIETDVNAFNCVSGTLTGTGGAQKSGSQLAPCEYDLSVVKTCDPAEGCVGSDIDISATITNGKFAQIDITSVTDSNGTPLTCTRANGTVVSPTFRMDPNEVVTCTGSTTPTTDGTYCDTITVKSATTFGEALPDKVSDEVCCKKILVKPVIDVVKACTAPQVSGGKITYEVKVNNLTPQTCNGQPWDVTLNCTATDTNPDVTYDQPLTFTLAPGANKTFTGSYSCAKLQCPTTLDVPNTFKVVCTDPYQQQATDQDSATCTCPCEDVGISVTKDCTPKGLNNQPGPITVSGTVCNDSTISPLTGVTVVDSTAVDLTCKNTAGVVIPQPFDLAVGACATCEGTVDCQDGYIVSDTFTATGTSPFGVKTDTATVPPNTCGCTPPQNEICRTPGFWGTHAGIEKARSQNITQKVIEKVGGLTVCGQTIDDTVVGSCDSAVEAICVSVKGEGQRQLVRQLTAAALNCVMTNGNANCSGVSIDQTFADCNQVCQGTPVAGWDIGKCKDAIDCFNNGGQYKDGFCQTGTCSDNDKPCNEDDLSQCGTSNPFLAFLNGTSCIPLPSNCHERELCNDDPSVDLCFEPPGPAGSSKQCNAANRNSLYVAEGACTQ